VRGWGEVGDRWAGVVEVVGAGRGRTAVRDEFFEDGGVAARDVVPRCHLALVLPRPRPLERALPLSGQGSQLRERRLRIRLRSGGGRGPRPAAEKGTEGEGGHPARPRGPPAGARARA